MHVVVAVLLYLVGFAVSWVFHLVRRLRGAYRRGYALVAQGTQVGAEIRPKEAFQLASSPVFLPPGAGTLPIAIIREAAGVRASRRDQGIVWTAKSGRVEQVLPSWTGLGPTGYLVLDVVRLATSAPLERVETATAPDVSNKDLMSDEPRRSWLLRSIGELTDWIVYDRLRAEVLGDPPREISDEELAQEIAARHGRGWMATRRLATVAGLAASEIATLPDRHLVGWTRPWATLTAQRDWVHPTTPFRTRALWRLGAVPDLIGRWPTVFAVLTVVLIAVVFAIDFAAGLVASVVGIGGLALALARRPPPPGRWRPDATSLELPVTAVRLRRAMAGLRRTSNPLYQVWLHHLLPGAHVWIAVDAEKPSNPDRWLAWLESNREEIPLQTFATPRGGRSAVAFTTATEHTSVERSLHIHWTLELDWASALRAARAARCTAVVLDSGRPWGIEATIPEG